MVKQTYLVISKREWGRLRRKKCSEKSTISTQHDEHAKQMVDKSKNWIKNWPDSKEGHLKQLHENKRLRYEEDKALIKSMLKKKKQDKTAVERAKQMIFNTSCYGRELISAVYESRALEERDAQIKFKSKAKEEAKIKDDEELADWKLKFDRLEKEDKRIIEEKKLREQEFVEINKLLHKMKIGKDDKDQGTENIEMTQRLMKDEQRQEKVYGEYFKKAVEKYASEQKTLKEQKVKREHLEDALVKLHRLELDRRNCKIQQVLRKMHHDKHDCETFTKHFEQIKNMQDAEQASYDTFVEKGIERQEKCIEEKDQMEQAAKEQRHNSFYAAAQYNKDIALEQNLCKNYYKCICDRQSLFTSSKEKKTVIDPRKKDYKDPLTFLRPLNKQLEDLKEREKETSPWSGTKAEHAQFAQRAAATLAECSRKFVARKVVDGYRKSNCLDEKSLPIANY